MTSLPEDLLLLAVDDTTGKVYSSESNALNYGLAGAALMDLLIAGRLDSADGKVTLANSTALGDAVLDDAALEIGRNEKGGDVQYWVDKLGNDKLGSDHLTERVLDQLIQQQILRKEEHRIAWVIPADRYPTVNPAPERQVSEHIRAAVLEGTAPEPRIAALIGLLKACDLTGLVFTKQERQEYGERIDQIGHGDAVGQAVSHAAEAAQAAMTGAIVGSIAASTAASVASTSSAGSS